MKAGVYYGARDIRFEEIEDLKAGPDDILVKVKSSGICGSDLHAYREGVFSRPGWVMGHEFAGEVVTVGANVKNIKKGDRVIPYDVHRRTGVKGCGKCFWCLRGEPRYCEETKSRQPCGKCEYCVAGQFYLCREIRRFQGIGYSRNGGYAEYVAVYNASLNNNVFKVPDNMSYDEGAIVEPLIGSIRWVAQTEPQSRDTAVVLGLGTIGLLVMQVLKQLVSKVIVSEVSQKRLQVARELGADLIIDASKEDPVQKVVEVTGVGRSGTGRGGARADIIMECSGAGIAFQQSLEMARAGGKINLVGLFEKPVSIDPNRIIFKDLKLISSQGSFAGNLKGNPVLQAIDMIASGKVKAKPLISHEFPLEKIKEAFEVQSRAAESVKVLVKPK
ncbi:MAG: alcohol dehydrogenase catalytic domain-containing protein [Chloroflexota bacterium]